MMDLSEAGLLQIARNYYPSGFPVTTDDYSQAQHPYQRTPEYARYVAAWNKATAWPKWTELLTEMRASFGTQCADCTQPWAAACRRCCIYSRNSLPNGSRQVIRVAVAVSILAPIYLTYCTTAVVTNQEQHHLQLSLEPLREVREHTSQLAALVERVLGYQPFPPHLANVPVPGIRVDFLPMGREPTLLDALFDSDLVNLP